MPCLFSSTLLLTCSFDYRSLLYLTHVYIQLLEGKLYCRCTLTCLRPRSFPLAMSLRNNRRKAHRKSVVGSFGRSKEVTAWRSAKRIAGIENRLSKFNFFSLYQETGSFNGEMNICLNQR